MTSRYDLGRSRQFLHRQKTLTASYDRAHVIAEIFRMMWEYNANQGVGRFTKLGIPFPHFTATFIGGLEIVGGLLFLTGFLTRLISVPFIIEMIVAILSTKISLFLGTSPLPLPPAPPKMGIWAVLHEIRADYAQIVTSAFLLINGPGKWSLDALLLKRPKTMRVRETAPTPAEVGLSSAR